MENEEFSSSIWCGPFAPQCFSLFVTSGCLRNSSVLSPKLPLIFLCVAKNRTDVSDGCFISGSHMPNDSEFPAGQRSPPAPSGAFIHKLDPSEVDLTETTAWLCNRTWAIHKWEVWSSWFWFAGTHIAFYDSACVCAWDTHLWQHDREPLCCLTIWDNASVLSHKAALWRNNEGAAFVMSTRTL